MKALRFMFAVALAACGAADHAQLMRVQHAHPDEIAACEAQHDGVACLRMGSTIVDSRWWRHIDWRTDEQSALASHYFLLACDAKVGEGCEKAAYESWHTDGTVLPAVELYDRACSLGSVQGCGEALLLAGQYYERNPTQIADFEKLATSICERQPSSCIDAAGRYPSLKKTGPRVEELLRSWVRRGCEKAPDVCAYSMAGEPRTGLFTLEESTAITARANTRQLELCAQGDWSWCGRMQLQLNEMLADGAQRPRAVEILTRNCSNGSQEACAILGRHLVDREIPPKPAPPFEPRERNLPVYPD